MSPSRVACVLVALVSCLAIFSARAEQLVAVVDARILTMSAAGDIERGTILIRDGTIIDVGSEVRVPSEARRIDAGGAIATPGFILMGNAAGAVEFPMTAGFDDSAGGGDLTAGFDVQYAVDPNSAYLPEIRREGSTLALVTPFLSPANKKPFGYFGGQTAMLRLGATGDRIVASPSAVTLQLGSQGAALAGGSRAIQIQQLKRLFDQLRAAGNDASKGIPGLAPEDVSALRDVLAKKKSLLVSASREGDILRALELARAYDLRMILDGAEEGWRVAPAIAAAKVSVLVGADSDTPNGSEEWGKTMANAARLDAAGVLVALKLSSGADIFKFPTSRFVAGVAVAHGLPYRKALESLTSAPAKMFGIDDRFGSIERGKQADLVLWSTDPLEPLSMVKLVMIAGVEQPLVSRKSLLRDRYLPKCKGTACT